MLKKLNLLSLFIIEIEFLARYLFGFKEQGNKLHREILFGIQKITECLNDLKKYI